MAESRITVTPTELEMALRVWITTAPKRVWRDYWHHAETAAKWSAGGDPFDRFDPRHALAKYLAEKFEQGRWEVSREPPKALGSPPAWSGEKS